MQSVPSCAGTPNTPLAVCCYRGLWWTVHPGKGSVPGLGDWPPAPQQYAVYISPVPEYIRGVDVLQGLWLHTTVGEFRLQVRVIKAVVREQVKHSPLVLPVPGRVLPGGHQEIGETIQELEKVGIVHPIHSALMPLNDQ